MNWIAKILTPFLVVATAPIILAMSCASSHQSTKKVDHFMPVDSKLLDNVVFNADEYDQIKNKQLTFNATDGQDGTVFENDFLKFHFDNKSLSQDILNGKDNALKLLKLAVSSMNITSQTHLNKDHKQLIQINGVDDSAQDAGGYSPSGIKIALAKNIFSKNFNGALDIYAQVINHEWGHYETVMPINSKYGTNDFGAHLEQSWDDFIKDVDMDNIENKWDLNNIYNKSNNSYSWHLDNDKIPFSSPENWFDLNASQKKLWASQVTNQIKNLPRVDLEVNNASSMLAELITRLQLSYTYQFDKDVILNDDYLSQSLIRNVFGNQIEAMKVLNYNLFDENNSSQAFLLMKSLLKDVYGVGVASGVKIFYDVNTNKPTSISFESLGMNYDKDIAQIILKNKQDNSVVTFPVTQEPIAFGFNRNIFNPLKEYKLVTNSAYAYAEFSNLSFIPEDIDIELKGKDGNFIKSPLLKVTFARDFNENYDLNTNTWVKK